MRLSAYLVRHTVGRWRENPWSPVARLTVATLMSLLLSATVCLFDVSVRLLRDKLEKSGANTVVVNRFVYGAAQPSCAELLGDLRRLGPTLSLARLGPFATADLNHRLVVYGYDAAALAFLPAGVRPAGAGAFIVDAGFPPGLRTRANLEGRDFPAESLARGTMLDFIPSDGADGVLLVPRDTVADMMRETGYTDVLVLLNRSKTVGVPEIADQVSRLNRIDRLNLFTFSAAGVLRRIEELEQRRLVVVPALIALTAGIITSVFAAISTLEHRENRFVFALLRSMGATPAALLVQFLAEGLCVAFGGAALALAAVYGAAAPAGRLLGMPEVTAFTREVLSSGTLPCILAGTLACAVLFSCAPIIPGLRKPIGMILS